MGAYSIRDLACSWIDDEIRLHPAAIGTEYGYEVTMGASPGPRGSVVHWTFLLTCRSPFVGKDHLGATARVSAHVPTEAGVRSFVRSSIPVLRESYDKLAAQARESGDGRRFLGAADKGRLN